MANERVLIEMDANLLKDVYDMFNFIEPANIYIYKQNNLLELSAITPDKTRLIIIKPKLQLIKKFELENVLSIDFYKLKEALKNYKAGETETVSIIEKEEAKLKYVYLVAKKKENRIGEVEEKEGNPLPEPVLATGPYAVVDSSLIDLAFKLYADANFSVLTFRSVSRPYFEEFKFILTGSNGSYIEISSRNSNKFINTEHPVSAEKVETSINLSLFSKRFIPQALRKKLIKVILGSDSNTPVIWEGESDRFIYKLYIAPLADVGEIPPPPQIDVEYEFDDRIADQLFALLKGIGSESGDLLIKADSNLKLAYLDPSHVKIAKLEVNGVEAENIGNRPLASHKLSVYYYNLGMGANACKELASAGITPKLSIGKSVYLCGVYLGSTEELEKKAESENDVLKIFDSVLEKLKKELCEKGRYKCISISGSDFIKASGSEYLKLAYLKPLNKIIVKADGKEIAKEADIKDRKDICPEPRTSAIEVIRTNLLFPPLSSRALDSLPINICFVYDEPAIISFDVESEYSKTKLLSFSLIVAPMIGEEFYKEVYNENWLSHANEEDVINALAESGGTMYEDDLKDALLAQLKDPSDVPRLIKSLEELEVVKTEKERGRVKITLLKAPEQIGEEEKKLKQIKSLVAQIDEISDKLKELMDVAKYMLDSFSKEADKVADFRNYAVDDYEKYVKNFLKKAEVNYHKALENTVDEIKAKKHLADELIVKVIKDAEALSKEAKSKGKDEIASKAQELIDHVRKLSDEIYKIDTVSLTDGYESVRQKLLDSIEQWKALKEELSSYPLATEDDVISAIKASGGRISEKDLMKTLFKGMKRNPTNIDDLISNLQRKGLVHIEAGEEGPFLVLTKAPEQKAREEELELIERIKENIEVILRQIKALWMHAEHLDFWNEVEKLKERMKYAEDYDAQVKDYLETKENKYRKSLEEIAKEIEAAQGRAEGELQIFLKRAEEARQKARERGKAELERVIDQMVNEVTATINEIRKYNPQELLKHFEEKRQELLNSVVEWGKMRAEKGKEDVVNLLKQIESYKQYLESIKEDAKRLESEADHVVSGGYWYEYLTIRGHKDFSDEYDKEVKEFLETKGKKYGEMVGRIANEYETKLNSAKLTYEGLITAANSLKKIAWETKNDKLKERVEKIEADAKSALDEIVKHDPRKYARSFQALNELLLELAEEWKKERGITEAKPPEKPSAQPQAPPAPQPKPPEAKPSPPPPKPPEAKPPSPPTPPPKPPEGTDEASKLIESARTKVKEWVGLYVPKTRAQAVLDSFENMVKDERASIEALLRAGKKEQAQDVIKSILDYIAKIIISISTRAKQNPEIAKYAGVPTEEAIAEVPEIYKPKEEEERIGFRPKEEESRFPGYPSFAKWWESRMSFVSRAYGAGAIPPIIPEHPNPFLGMFPIFVSKRNGIIELSGTTFSGLRKILEQAGIKIEYRASFTREELLTLIESAYDKVSKNAKEWLDELKSKL
jgi:uncharacterized membrane protein/polyhydroxyalkanoate synthesis regulator phasin